MVRIEDKWGYADKQNGNRVHVVIKPEYDVVSNFSEGLARVKVEELWGYIDMNGEFVIVPKFKYAEDFSDGKARVSSSGLDGGHYHYHYIENPLLQ